jgi:hypothetical protein
MTVVACCCWTGATFSIQYYVLAIEDGLYANNGERSPRFFEPTQSRA